MKRPSLLLPLLLPVLLPACSVQRHAAETAVVEVMADYAMIRTQVENVAPDQAKIIAEAIDASKRSVEQGDLRAALLATRELQARLKDLSDRLPAMQAELESTWTDLNTSVPGTLASLDRTLNRSTRPPAGARRVAFDAARSDLPILMAQWSESEDAMHAGRLAEAVSKGEYIRDRAFRLLADIQDGS